MRSDMARLSLRAPDISPYEQTANRSGNKRRTEYPKTGYKCINQGARKSLKGKGGHVFVMAHNPKVGGSNPSPATKSHFIIYATSVNGGILYLRTIAGASCHVFQESHISFIYYGVTQTSASISESLKT